MMNWPEHGMTPWTYASMSLANIVIWGVLAAVGVVVYRLTRRPGEGAAHASDPRGPEQILADRFARGAIDADEYHSRLQTLRAAAANSPAGDRAGGS
jgi:putative membrane protein